MKILVVHNKYRQAGGEDAVVSAEVALLRAQGFDVEEYFATNESAGGGWRGTVDLIGSSAWSQKIYSDLREVCVRFRPDVAHIHNFWMKLSPSVHEAMCDEGVATVQTLHNFRLLCVNALLLRNGAVCEDCVGRMPWRGVIRRCYRHSFFASAAVARMISASTRRRIWADKVDAYIALSNSSRSRFIAGGIPADRIFVKPNFVWPRQADASTPQDSRTFVYAGRLSEEKGILVLLEAWARLEAAGLEGKEARLIIAGGGPLLDDLRTFVSARGLAGSVTVAGPLPAGEVQRLIGGSRAVVLPSLCLENFPRTLVEAFVCGRGVIASDLGALGELVNHRRTGLLFRPGDPASLALALRSLLQDDGLAERLGKAALQEYGEKYTPAKNLKSLQKIYRFAIDRHAGALRFRPDARRVPANVVATLGTWGTNG